MKNIYGFGLLEIIITLAITAICSTVGLTVYNNHIVKSNQEAMKHEMLQLMTDFEKHYSKSGSYTTKDGALPNGLENALGNERKYYQISVYPIAGNQVANKSGNQAANKLAANTQAICLVAEPLDNTVMQNSGVIVVDNHGNIAVGEQKDSNQPCVVTVPDPSGDEKPTQLPVPTPDSCKNISTFLDAYNKKDICCNKDATFMSIWDSKYNFCGSNACTASTSYETSRDCYCGFHADDFKCNSTPDVPDETVTPTPSPTPTPMPSPTVNPQPIPAACIDLPKDAKLVGWYKQNGSGDQCKPNATTHYVDNQPECKRKGPFQGCNGNCEGTTNYIIDKTALPDYSTGCNGTCHDSITVFESNFVNGLVNGAGGSDRAIVCNGWANGIGKDAVIYGPASRSLLCNGQCDRTKLIVNAKAPEGVVCSGECHNVKITVPKSWGVEVISQICNGHCDSSSFSVY